MDYCLLLELNLLNYFIGITINIIDYFGELHFDLLSILIITIVS